MYTPKPKKRVAIVVPTHKINFSADEQISLNHLNLYLNKYDKFLVLPEKLKNKKFKLKGFKSNFYLDNSNFVSWASYCEMMLKEEFYQQFSNYEYILIYQVDVIVFSDQLEYWCKKGYDNIGAPFFRPINFGPPFFEPIIGFLSRKKDSPLCGCGGFCLRKVESCIKMIQLVNNQATRKSKNLRLRRLWFLIAALTGKSHHKWLKAPADSYPFAEDGFWSFEAPKYDSKFRLGSFQDSLKFSFERFPRHCFNLNKNKLPFGAHAWAKHDKAFWEPYLVKLNKKSEKKIVG